MLLEARFKKIEQELARISYKEHEHFIIGTEGNDGKLYDSKGVEIIDDHPEACPKNRQVFIITEGEDENEMSAQN